MKRQAAYHGEVGANGKAYQKGQFIAEQPENHTQASKGKKGSGKQEIEPYVWAVPEDPEMRSILSYLVGMGVNIRTGEINHDVLSFYNENVAKVESLAARYLAGERWYYPAQETYM